MASPAALPCWLRQERDACLLILHVQPGAKRTEVAGEHGDALKVRLAAPPVEGRANQALIGYLAGALRIPKRQVTLVSGEASREKRVRIEGTDAAEIVARFAPAAPVAPS